MKSRPSYGFTPMRIILITTIIILLVCAGLYFPQGNAHARGHALVDQRTKLVHTFEGLQMLVMEDPDVLKRIDTNGVVILESQMMEIIRTSKRGDDLMKWMNLGSYNCFMDVWKHPLRFRFERVDTLSGKAEVMVWSIGPNGIDENGKGDDLVISGEVFKP